VLSEVPAACAGIFTRNVVKGHSLKWSKNNISKGIARAVVINSGCANACVGPDGDRDAREMAEKVASLIGCDPTQVFLGSTGVIGYRLDMDKITDGIHKAYAALSPEGGRSAAQAIMTTDTFCKEAAETLVLDGHTITIGGMAKGSGMIHPNMAP
jgi:glutamate N-acetyltransferase/amino-acid N-acetyltransferase